MSSSLFSVLPSSAKARFMGSSTPYGQAAYAAFPSSSLYSGSISQQAPSDSYAPPPYHSTNQPDSSIPPEPTDLHTADNTKLYYSELHTLLQTGQVKEIKIQINPKSFAPLPIAKVKMKDGHTNNLMLPRDLAEFTETLDAAHVPYTYRSSAHEGLLGKTADLVGNVAEEMIAPFLLLGGTAWLGMWGTKKFGEIQENRELKKNLMKATRNPGLYPHDYQELLSYHTPHSQAVMEEFQHGASHVLIVKGYPGLGKTHILKALQKAVSGNETVVLDVGAQKVGQEALDLLSNLYGGDKLLAPKALKLLREQNQGRPVNEILIVADELEKISSTQVGELLTKGTGNPDEGGKLELPKLRLLATCNAWPDLVNDEAVASRISKVLITPPSPEITTRILAESMHNAPIGKARRHPLPDKKELQEAFAQVLQGYPGYSPRSLTNYVQPALLREHNKGDKPLSATELANNLAERLKHRPLNSTELAGLIVHNTMEKVLAQNPGLDRSKGGMQIWTDLHDSAANKTRDARDRLLLDGKSAQGQIAKALADYDLSIQDPGSIDAASEHVVTELKKNRLAALNTVEGDAKVEQTVLKEMTSFLEELRKTEELAEKVEKRERPTAEDKATLTRLAQLKTALRQPFLSGSPEAAHLREAAKLWTEIHQETDPEKVNFPDKARLQAVMSRVLDFDPTKHTADNDYNLVPDENFVALFKSLRKLLASVNVRLPHPA
jgi:hypothetical protein